MIAFGFNLPFGKRVVLKEGKTLSPPRIIGIGIGFSRSERLRFPDRSKIPGLYTTATKPPDD